MMKHFLFFLLVWGCCLAGRAQETYRQCTVIDSNTSLPISDCHINYTTHGKRHTVTDSLGIFSIVEYATAITLTHVSYHPKRVEWEDVEKGVIRLIPNNIQLQETTIYAQTPISKGNLFKYDIRQAAATISVIGEPDILRHISTFPSVSTGVEGTLGLFVRGGSNASNRLYFNEVPIYASTHLLGLFSVFPPEMVDEATFYMGGIPAYRGNLSSSLLEISTKKEYGTSFKGKFYLSPYLSGIYTVLPLIKDKLSLQLSGRSTFAPYIVNWFNKTDDKLKVDIYDVTATLDFRITPKQTMNAMFLLANDYFGFTEENISGNIQRWNSVAGKLGWNARLNDRWSMNASAYYTRVHAEQKKMNYRNDGSEIESMIGVSSTLEEQAGKVALHSNINRHLTLNGGLSVEHRRFTPGNKKYIANVTNHDFTDKKSHSLGAVFLEISYDIPRLMDLRVGYRQTVQKWGKEKKAAFDLHILNHWFIRQNMGVELAFDRQNQFFHVLEGLPVGWSMNIMTPADTEYPAERTEQGYGGIFWKPMIGKAAIKASVGGYYRTMKNLMTYTNAINAFGFNTASWQEEVDLGRGKSYGLEVASSLHTTRLQASLAYTLSKTTRNFPKMNRMLDFPFKFDRRHILNLQGEYTLNRRILKNGKQVEHFIGTAVAYASGNRVTLPIGTYQGIMPPYWNQSSGGRIYPPEFYQHIYDREQLSAKNSTSMRNYFRTDMAYRLSRKGKIYTHEFYFSIYNLFNRHNPYLYFHEEGGWKQLSIMPIMPSVRWSVSW